VSGGGGVLPPPAAPVAAAPAAPRRMLARLGAAARRPVGTTLTLLALSAGVLAEAGRPSAWRRPARSEFRRSLVQAAGGALGTVLVTAVLLGLGMVAQALYWLALAGQEGIAGRVLVTVLVRELAPVLVGFVLLGRSGTVATVELGALAAAGQVRMLRAAGLDPFRLLVLPRAAALAVAAFALGVLFVVAALATGWLAGSLLGLVRAAPGAFLDNVLTAMAAADFVIFPLKLLVIGALVGLTAAMTGLAAGRRDTAATLLPRGFMRGVLALLLASGAMSLAA
jgi:phospholipid/cholesterol/gamma-HCH transport system permease protein